MGYESSGAEPDYPAPETAQWVEIQIWSFAAFYGI